MKMNIMCKPIIGLSISLWLPSNRMWINSLSLSLPPSPLKLKYPTGTEWPNESGVLSSSSLSSPSLVQATSTASTVGTSRKGATNQN